MVQSHTTEVEWKSDETVESYTPSGPGSVAERSTPIILERNWKSDGTVHSNNTANGLGV